MRVMQASLESRPQLYFTIHVVFIMAFALSPKLQKIATTENNQAQAEQCNRRFLSPHCHLTHCFHGTPANIRITRYTARKPEWLGHYILPSTALTYDVFIQITAVTSEEQIICTAESVGLMPVQGHLRLLVIAPIKWTYATSYWW